MRLGARGWLLAALVGLAGCQQERDAGPAAPTPISTELPALTLKDDSPSLLLTYVDEQGDFHVVQKPLDVPEAHRAQVRVVDTTREAGTGALVYVADLRKKGADGTYPVTTLSRSGWDELGAERRKARLEALAPSASASASAAPASAQPSAPTPPAKAGPKKLYAIVYGASWCKPCHDASEYLKQRGVTVSYRDIETSDAVATELQKKLERAKMGGASIPIIDFGGRLLVGFSPSQLDRIIAAQGGQVPL